jgi:hypothetical protein
MNAFESFPPQPAAEEAAVIQQAEPPSIGRKNPNLAALFAAFPGLGHVYNGLYVRGLVFFLLIASLIAIASRGHGLAGFAIAFFWLFNAIDAYRQATLINYGYAMDLGLVDLPRYPLASQAGVVAGALLVLIGLFALADRYLTINLDWLFDLWPVGLILVGGWLIVGAIRDKKRARERAAGPTGI